ncbi:hypothetical protein BD410DRAFT_259806 [Rickenella mellea]|uniref:Uncharacterized protein n=1 Tax=Rickenella mellea TaxID=50990 RepID=A0A4Y7Q430_9AGAM|nr:hypothetical protein BD410DRAFT_259806 [Rickenella mellea]
MDLSQWMSGLESEIVLGHVMTCWTSTTTTLTGRLDIAALQLFAEVSEQLERRYIVVICSNAVMVHSCNRLVLVWASQVYNATEAARSLETESLAATVCLVSVSTAWFLPSSRLVTVPQ